MTLSQADQILGRGFLPGHLHPPLGCGLSNKPGPDKVNPLRLNYWPISQAT